MTPIAGMKFLALNDGRLEVREIPGAKFHELLIRKTLFLVDGKFVNFVEALRGANLCKIVGSIAIGAGVIHVHVEVGGNPEIAGVAFESQRMECYVSDGLLLWTGLHGFAIGLKVWAPGSRYGVSALRHMQDGWKFHSAERVKVVRFRGGLCAIVAVVRVDSSFVGCEEAAPGIHNGKSRGSGGIDLQSVTGTKISAFHTFQSLPRCATGELKDDFGVAVCVGDESDLVSVGRPAWICLVPIAVGNREGIAAIGGHQP